MRFFGYNVPDLEDDFQVISEEEIIETYFPYWSEQMKKAGKENRISKEQCIEDWIIVNYAWEIGKRG